MVNKRSLHRGTIGLIVLALGLAPAAAFAQAPPKFVREIHLAPALGIPYPVNCEFIGDIGSTPDGGATWQFGIDYLDGYDEFAVTSFPTGTGGTTRVLLIDGWTGLVAGHWDGPSPFGMSATGGLDVWYPSGSNPVGDHVPDIVISDPKASGSIWIYSGSDPFNASIRIRWPDVGINLGATGEALTLLGDVAGPGLGNDPDGFSEIVVGTPNPAAVVLEDKTYLADPRTGTTPWKVIDNPLTSEGKSFGKSVAVVGDLYHRARHELDDQQQLDWDKFPEVVIGDPEASFTSQNNGYLAVFSVDKTGGAKVINGDVSGLEEVQGTAADELVGFNVAFMGLASSEPSVLPWYPWTYAFRRNHLSNASAVVRYPNRDPTNVNLEAMRELASLTGTLPYADDLQGAVPRQLTSAADLDQDGYPDLAVAKDVGGASAHVVEFWSVVGSPTLIYRVTGLKGVVPPGTANARWTTVNTVGDQDGDGNPDVAILSNVATLGGGEKTVIRIYGSPVIPAGPDPPQLPGTPRITGNTVAETGRRLMIEIYNAPIALGSPGKLYRSTQLLSTPISCGGYLRWVDDPNPRNISFVEGRYRYIEHLKFAEIPVGTTIYFQAAATDGSGNCQAISVVWSVNILQLTDPRYERPSDIWKRP